MDPGTRVTSGSLHELRLLNFHTFCRIFKEKTKTKTPACSVLEMKKPAFYEHELDGILHERALGILHSQGSVWIHVRAGNALICISTRLQQGQMWVGLDFSSNAEPISSLSSSPSTARHGQAQTGGCVKENLLI